MVSQPAGSPGFHCCRSAGVMAKHLLAAIRRDSLRTQIASLLDQRGVIAVAIDVLWSGD